MSPKIQMRKRLYVDGQVQRALVVRMVVLWLLCQVTTALMMLFWVILVRPDAWFLIRSPLTDPWHFIVPTVLISSCMMLPLVIIDMIRLSNRFVGPMVSLRQSIKALARGEHVNPIQFRRNDFWQDFAEDFNAMLAQVDSPSPASVDWPAEMSAVRSEDATGQPVGTQ